MPVLDPLPPSPVQGQGNPAAPGRARTVQPFGEHPVRPAPGTMPPINVPPPASPVRPPAGGVGGLAAPPPASTPVGAGEPPGIFPSIPGMNMTDVGPDRQDPFPNRAFADIITSVEEAPTGRFMLGVGANSFQGLMGSVRSMRRTSTSSTFPARWPTCQRQGVPRRRPGLPDQLDGRHPDQPDAGQPPRALPVRPADRCRRHRLPVPAHLSRLGPRAAAAAGSRWAASSAPATYTDVAVRVENVDFYGYQTPAPADFLAASGSTPLSSLRPSLRFDNRNPPFMPNKGQYLELSFEQGLGTFTFTKAELEGRTYFTTGSRPDGSG